MGLTILVVAVAVILALLVYASMRPNEFRVERSASIAAPPQVVCGLVDDFHRWTEWSPWEPLDPAMRKTYSGAASGPGAIYEWEGNNKVGKGRMEIVSETAESLVHIKVDFLKPFEAHNLAEFLLAPEAGATRVTWAMQGKSAFPVKVMGIFVSMDKMMGKDFEKGLARMKAVAEG